MLVLGGYLPNLGVDSSADGVDLKAGAGIPVMVSGGKSRDSGGEGLDPTEGNKDRLDSAEIGTERLGSVGTERETGSDNSIPEKEVWRVSMM